VAQDRRDLSNNGRGDADLDLASAQFLHERPAPRVLVWWLPPDIRARLEWAA